MAHRKVSGPLPQEHVLKLARRLIDGQLSLFVGAGLSHLAPAKDGSDRRLPLWPRLTEKVAEACDVDVDDFLGEPLDLFDAIVYGQERATLERAIAAALDDTGFELAPAHRILGDLPWPAVVSTNYDGLLQSLLSEDPVAIEDDYDRRSAPEERQPRLFQIHGTRLRPHTLTKDDYRLWEEKHPRAARHLHELMERGTLLFVGYSLSDPHLDSILATVRKITQGREKRLYAWMWRYPEPKIRLLDQRDKIEAVSIEDEKHWEAGFRQLATTVQELRRRERPAPAPVGADSFAYDRDQYLQAVRTRYGSANLQGLYVWGSGYARNDVALGEVFVEPDLLRREPAFGPESEPVVPRTLREIRRLREERPDEPGSPGRRIAALSLLRQEPLVVIIGAPGQGKSTLLRAWLLTVAERWAADPEDQLFPVLVRLAEWEGRTEASETSLVDFVRGRLPKLGEVGSNAVEQWLGGPVLWLLDGVDEVRDRYERERLREEVLALASQRPGDHWIVSTRPAGEPAGGWASGWMRTEVPSLSDRQIEAVLAAWGRVLEAKEGLVLDTREMAQSLQKDPCLRTLRGNALLLTLAVLFYKSRRRLPNDRWDFFEVAEQVLRDSWVYHRVRRAEEHLPGAYLPGLLERLALAGMKEGAVLFSRERLAEEASELLLERGYSGAERDQEIARFLRAAEDLIGVLVAQGPDQFGFLHLTFQEFLAARALVHRSAEMPEYIARYWDYPDWEQVWMLYALGVESDVNRVDEFHSTILASGHALDEHLNRPRLASVWLAGLGSSPLPKAVQESVDWACSIVRSDSPVWKRGAVWGAFATWERALPKGIFETALETLEEREHPVRAPAVGLLSSLASEPAVRQTLLALLTEEKPHLREAASTALGSQTSEPAVRQALLRRLEDQDPTVRSSAVGALKSAAYEPAVSHALLQRLQDEDPTVRSSAAEALASSASEPAVRDALLQGLEDPEFDVRTMAAESLRFVAFTPEVTESLLELLDSPEAGIRWAAAGALSSSTPEPALCEALLARLDSQDSIARWTAARALHMASAQPTVRSALLERLRDDFAPVRWAAAYSLGSTASESMVQKALLLRLEDPDGNVRLAAARALASVTSQSAVRQALLLRLDDQEPGVRRNAAEVLASETSELTVRQALLRRLEDQEPAVRRSAAKALASVASEPAVRQALLRRLEDKELDVQTAILGSLLTGIEHEKFGLG